MTIHTPGFDVGKNNTAKNLSSHAKVHVQEIAFHEMYVMGRQ